MRCRVKQVQAETRHVPTKGLCPRTTSFKHTMTVNIYLRSSFRVSLNLKGNKLAASALSEEITEAKDVELASEDIDSDVQRVSNALSDATLVYVDSVVEYPQWIASVGDIVRATSCIDRPRWSSSRYGSFKTVGNPLISKGSAIQRCTKPSGSRRRRRQGNDTHSALRQHCDFWNTNGDGFVYPWDIYTGFRRLGFHFVLCLWAAVTMAVCASYNTQTSYVPHPLFAINLDNINSNRHGSSTGAYDMGGELDERRFEAIFQRYARGKDYLTLWSTYNVWRNQRCGLDFFGWFAGGLECKQSMRGL